MDEEFEKRLDGRMQQINANFERIHDMMSLIRRDIDSTRGHLISALQEKLALSQRLTKVEEGLQELRTRWPSTPGRGD